MKTASSAMGMQALLAKDPPWRTSMKQELTVLMERQLDCSASLTVRRCCSGSKFHISISVSGLHVCGVTVNVLHYITSTKCMTGLLVAQASTARADEFTD